MRRFYKVDNKIGCLFFRFSGQHCLKAISHPHINSSRIMFLERIKYDCQFIINDFVFFFEFFERDHEVLQLKTSQNLKFLRNQSLYMIPKILNSWFMNKYYFICKLKNISTHFNLLVSILISNHLHKLLSFILLL